MKTLVVIAGSLAQQPRQAGLAWFYAQLLLGFQRLGCDVLFLDRLDPDMCVSEQGSPSRFEDSANRRHFLRVMREFGLQDTFHLSYDYGKQVLGLDRAATTEKIRSSSLLINVMGFFNDEALLSGARRKAFLDIDPGFPQMWRELGLHDAFCGYDDYVTLGRNIGLPECTIPTCGLRWVTMAQPVVLDRWPLAAGGEKFTSIGAWRGQNAAVEFGGRTYGLRVHEFRRFFALPRNCRAPLEMALEIHADEKKDLEQLSSHGWQLVDPRDAVPTPGRYRRYLARSRAEFMIPKQMYVESRSGLLSDRSVYYLASGKPVLALDTGLKDLYPTGRGLVTFSTLDEAAAGVEDILGNYAEHSGAARQIAEDHFDSDKVLRKLLDDLGVPTP